MADAAGLHAVGGDPVGQAIADAAGSGQKTQRVEMTQAQLVLASGRPAVLAFPVDLTPKEALSLVGGILQIIDRVEANRQPASRIQRASCLPRSLRR